jgi:hypothetical protein
MNRTIRLTVALIVVGCSSGLRADYAIGTPKNLGSTINSSAGDITPTASADGLSLYFSSERSEGFGGRGDIWLASRITLDSEWRPAVNLGSVVNSSACEASPSISQDELSLYFCDGIWGLGSSRRPGGQGSADLWVTTRASKDEDWGPPVNLGQRINSSFYDGEPAISSDGLSLYFDSSRSGSGNLDIYEATRITKDDPWLSPVKLGPIINSGFSEADPSISTDGCTLFFTRNISGEDFNVWMTTRRNPGEPWESPVNLGPGVNTSGYMAHDWGPKISSDGSTLYFCANRPGGFGFYDLWQADIYPLVDFSGDCAVDIDDLVRLIDQWGSSEMLCDIGPMPWGDGVVDVHDLEVLMNFWAQDVNNPTLLAYWKLDETEGNTAYDSAAENDATVIGDALWQPEGGQVEGALVLDGISNYVDSPFVLNPAEGFFSVFIWIKGGEPGQVILSQEDGADWLLADAQGCLMTALISEGRQPGNPLYSERIMTDGNWHRVGLVWDRSYRSLYVDDELVATDVGLQDNFPSSQGALHIGAANNPQPGTFWSGLIDDVRIYNRVVTP